MKNHLSQFALCILSAAFLLVSATSACGRKLPGTSPTSSEPSSATASASSSASFASSGSVTENPVPSPTTPSSLSQTPSPTPSGNTTNNQEWAIYWYLCGSDLETRFEAGTEDLAEMLAIALPDGITVVIQTGGASEWAHEAIDADKLQRFIYDRDGLRLVEERPLGNMGHAEVFQDFLAYAKENHPAERVMINIWDHGGGTLAGAAFDELHGMDSLKLPEMHQAISGVFEENKAHPPVDIIGFDACLMATVDVAATFSGLSRYLVASQEVEPGGGWDYSAIFNALAEEPETDPYELATIICDSYLRICEKTDTADIATLSVTDLSGMDDLLEAYDNSPARCCRCGGRAKGSGGFCSGLFQHPMLWAKRGGLRVHQHGGFGAAGRQSGDNRTVLLSHAAGCPRRGCPLQGQRTPAIQRLGSVPSIAHMTAVWIISTCTRAGCR